jgi:putrescine aminotransferase
VLSLQHVVDPAAKLVAVVVLEFDAPAAAAGYLAAARELCTRYGTQLVFDEVQTGLGRTGAMFAFQRDEVTPDVLVLAKSLGGGIVPVAATLCAGELHRRAYGAMDRFDLHGSTFAGNALACAAAMATLDISEREGLVERSARLGTLLLEGLRARLHGHPLVRAIRGRGLLVGLDLGTTTTGLLRGVGARLAALGSRGSLGSLASKLAPPPFIGQWISVRLLEAGYVCQPTAHEWDVLKIEPPLTISELELQGFVTALGEILDEYSGAAAVVRDVGVRMTSRGARGWAW